MKARDPIPALEWAAAAFGLLIALAMLGIIIREIFVGRDDPVPVLVADVQRLVSNPTGHVVEVRVRNLSDQTAAAVHVEGELGGDEPVTSAASIDYVPGNSEAIGGLVFAEDPRGRDLKVRVTGFEIP